MRPDSPFGHLRPTTTPEMLDRAYGVAVRFWPVLWGAAVVVALDHLLAILVLGWDRPVRHEAWHVGLTLGLSLVGDFAAGCALLAVFQGLIFPLRPVSAKAILRTALRKFPLFFLTNLLFVTLVAFFGLMGLRALRSGVMGAGYVPNLLAGLVLIGVAVVCGVRFCLGSIASLIEDANPISALRRSWHLTAAWPSGFRLRKDRPLVRLFSILLLPMLASVGVLFVGLGVGVLGLGVPLPGRVNVLSTSVMMESIGFAATLVAMPLLWAGLMAVYVEYRMRTEALDFYLRLRELSREAPGQYPL